MLIISSWLCPKCTFILLYTTVNLKACKINRQKSKKVRDVSKGGGGVSPEERLYDVSRGQNRYVTLPLAKIFHVKFIFTSSKTTDLSEYDDIDACSSDQK